VTAVLAAILALGLPTTTQASTTTMQLAAGGDGRRMALGLSMLPDRSRETYDDIARRLGRAPAMWSFWSNWGALDRRGCRGGPSSMPPTGPLVSHVVEQGSVPVIIWQPADPARIERPLYTYSKIARGDFDCYLRRFAEAVADIEGPVILRFAHEFDGYWFAWGMGRFTNTPKSFVRAWRHIWDIFRGPDGLAPNARFLWSPNGCPCPEQMEELFPGDQYVDYLGMTAFNWGAWQRVDGKPRPWIQLDTIVERRLGGFANLPFKPVIITETGSTHRGGNKARWITRGYTALLERFPQVLAVMYFNVDISALGDPNAQENWLLTLPRSRSALRAYRELVQDTRFQGTVP
jgi:hypothetical protein